MELHPMTDTAQINLVNREEARATARPLAGTFRDEPAGDLTPTRAGPRSPPGFLVSRLWH
jgi:hypothetical protein